MIKQTRKFTPSKNRLRNLTQYKDMTDEDFEEIYKNVFLEDDIEDDVDADDIIEEMKQREQAKIDELGNDYDLSDMKANDMMQLQSLVTAMILLEDLEKTFYKMTLSSDNIHVVEKLNKMMSDLRSDISKLSTDLQLTKKIRNQSNETSVREKWEELTKKAHEFFQQKMLFIFCIKCKSLLATIWLLYPQNKDNKIHLHCEKCGNEFDQTLDGLYFTGNKNLDDVRIP